MKLYEIHDSTLPANMKLTLSTLLNRSGLFESREEKYYSIKNDKVSIRGRDVEIDSPGQLIKIKDNTVIKVKGKGSMRIRINGDNLAEKREQDNINREIGDMQRNL